MLFSTLFTLLIFVTTFYGTALLRRYALRHQLLDVPNHRSSHHQPTPRGGGIAIVLIFFVGAVILASNHWLTGDLLLALSGGLVVAFISAWDDICPLPAQIRLAAHLMAAAWALYWLASLPEIPFLGLTLRPSLALGAPLAILWITWLINLYNFMDGIDGLAGAEAATTALFASGFFALVSSNPGLAHLSLALALAALAFILWNWPPAKIFMGDVGSCFLGFCFALLSLIGPEQGGMPLWTWLILLAVFICDATFTLIQRFLTGQAWHQPHCSHGYQRAAQALGHRNTTLAITAINLFWLWPWAAYTVWQPQYGALATMIAYCPLLLLARYLKAGEPNRMTTINQT